MRDVLPDEVIDAIKDHLSTRAAEVQGAVWESASQEEDSLTGDFFGSLRTSKRSEMVEGREYRWSVTYKKLRGRGPGAPEKKTGTDGIFEVEVEDTNVGVIHRKALPFQAKKNWTGKDSRLVEQTKTMEKLTNGASGVIDYSSDGFSGSDGSTVLENEGRPPRNRSSAGEYLGRVVECRSGSRNVFYDAARGLLLVNDIAVRLFVEHRLRVSVEVI